MPSISIFHSTFTREKEIRDQLAKTTGFSVIDDQHIINEAAKRFSTTPQKIAKALYHKPSVFNKFTLEREHCVAYVKSVLADKLTQSQNLYFGFISSLIPAKITHVLKLLLVDNREVRIERATKEGASLREAEKIIKESDKSAYNWADFLFKAEPWDEKLYDIIIPVSQKPTDEIVRLVTEQCAQGAVLERKASKKAIEDMTVAARAEIALLQKGHKTDIEVSDGKIHLNVNKSVINFTSLQNEMQEIVAPLAIPYGVEVRMGQNYVTSIYRDQEFKLPTRVLLVDDEKDFALTLSERLISRNVGSYAVYDGQEALALLKDDKPDVMVLDLKMPGVDGLEVLKQTKEQNPDIEVIILTGHGTEADRQSCLKLGAFAYLQKPTDIQTLSATIHEAHKKVTAREAQQEIS